MLVSRLSKIWAPSAAGMAVSGVEDGHAKLVRAGFLRQSHAGIFHMLPLGHRVQHKIESIIARHMEASLAASRLSLSTLSGAALWTKSGRLAGAGSELFTLTDRKDTPYLLSPTHEEEITSLVARCITSYKDLPLRLYQITRKYRDEFRPRHGLLRAREFTMKDLYTFDLSVEAALATYALVQAAYTATFAEIGLPVVVAKASSGDMGGDLSHEYHLPSRIGEDRLVSCHDCGFAMNDEIADMMAPAKPASAGPVRVWRGITKDRRTLVNVWYPDTIAGSPGTEARACTHLDVNLSAVKALVPGLDTAVQDVFPLWLETSSTPQRTALNLVNLVDGRIDPARMLEISPAHVLEEPAWPAQMGPPGPSMSVSTKTQAGHPKPLNLLRAQEGDMCPECTMGRLRIQRAIELGHTFHLGTRYSVPLGAQVSVPAALPDLGRDKTATTSTTGGMQQKIPLQMGCHGIGVSRVMGATAHHFADEKGLNWPASIAPYSCVVIPAGVEDEEDAQILASRLVSCSTARPEPIDVILDDRHLSIPWRLTDADLIGFPILVVLGKEWRATKRVEIQCRKKGFKDVVDCDGIYDVISRLI